MLAASRQLLAPAVRAWVVPLAVPARRLLPPSLTLYLTFDCSLCISHQAWAGWPGNPSFPLHLPPFCSLSATLILTLLPAGLDWEVVAALAEGCEPPPARPPTRPLMRSWAL